VQVNIVSHVLQLLTRQAVHIPDINPYPSLQSVQVPAAVGQVRQFISVQVAIAAEQTLEANVKYG
jgi:hypothetical protein